MRDSSPRLDSLLNLPRPLLSSVSRPVDLVCRNARKSPKFYKDPPGLRALYEKDRERERERESLGPCTNLHLENIMKQREATISRSEMTDGFGPPQVLPLPSTREGPECFAQHRPMKQRARNVGSRLRWDGVLNDRGAVVFIKVVVRG